MKLRRSLKNKLKNTNPSEFTTFSHDSNWPTDKMVNDYVNNSEEISDIVNKSKNNLIVGNWFLLRIAGCLYISKEKPEKVHNIWTLGRLDPAGWLQLDGDGSKFIKPPYSLLTREDFSHLELPELLDEDSPLEIEIMKSGNVYYYES